MNAEKFWYSWLKTTTILVIVAGFALSLLSRTTHFLTINQRINHIFFSDNLTDTTSFIFQRQLFGILGIIAAIWGIIVLFLSFYAIKKRQFRYWNSIFYTLIFWFIVDTSFSIYYQSALNVFVNCIFFLQIAAPLLFIRNSFKPNQQATA